ncbi:MAG: ABC transporter permease [Blastocatellia bacterium]|nr:ABC transporter permease [Blastocatellia bacterium]MCS7157816.1 ABC transporter permease [Blastocatellia bacterium]MCX7753329.1 ABC transporter permease [Blastocatellia bacterium]MDW8168108.1 FtsX-like permease family protein [Acidobacteriota bacterium]MDW8257644.1 FtsX-like permease family protein [Acidobacteriota bacterium]
MLLKYNVRSLLVRWGSTALTVLGIALTTAIFVGVMALAEGLETALGTTGEPQHVLVRRRGSDSEGSSFIPRDIWPMVRYLPGIARDSRGEPLASAELAVIINLPRRGETQGVNVTVRGLSPESLALRPRVRIVEGRMFRPGLREAIVARRLSERFQNLGLGDEVRFGKGSWRVVGLFEAGNTAFDSEIWVDVNQLASDYNRPGYSSFLLKATDEAALKTLIERIEQERRYPLLAQPEMEYYREQTRVAGPIRALGMFLVLVLGVGAGFAAMNTMDAAVAFRAREIATLRALGFRRRQIGIAFLVESALLGLIGGAIGSALALPVHGLTTGTANWETFSEIIFAFRVTPALMLTGLVFATLVGALGGMLPARRAARQAPALVLREL